MEFPTINISSNARHLGRMKKGHKVRLCGGDLPICLHPDSHKKVMKALSKGKGVHYAMTPDEISMNHGKGFFDFIKSVTSGGTSNLINAISPALKPIGKVLLPVAKTIGHKAIDAAVLAAPTLGGMAGAAAGAFLGPEAIPFGEIAGSYLGGLAGKELGKYAGSELDNFDPYHTEQVHQDTGAVLSPAYNALAPPSRQSQTNTLLSTPPPSAGRDTSKQHHGHLRAANASQLAANMGYSQLESLAAEKRKQVGQPHFDYSGGQSMSQYADAVPATGSGLYGSGLYGGTGGGLYAGGRRPVGSGLGAGVRQHGRMESGSIGIRGNLMLHDPPALRSQAASQNFQWGNRLPPAFQASAHSAM